jgi:cytochrome c-type biogenesis protein CcmH
MHIRTHWVAGALLLAVALNLAVAGEAQPTAEDPVVEARMLRISDELRCLVCQNESLASSRADLAVDLRQEVRSLIRQNRSDQDIKAYLVERYGDYVLYRPEIKPLTWVLWFGPFALLLLAAWSLWRTLRQRQAQLLGQETPLDEAERARAQRLLGDPEAHS